MHGPTFMANPLACAVAIASIDLLLGSGWSERVSAVNAALASGLAPLRHRTGVVDVRTLGAVGVVQLDHAVDVPRASAVAVTCGVWLRPFRDLVYTMPPYVCTDGDIATICAAIAAVVEAETG